MTSLLAAPEPRLRADGHLDAHLLPQTGRTRRFSSTTVVFATALSLYLFAAWQLAITHHAVVGDAMARVANGSYVISSRDPHLAAVGFVWNPLPSFAALPFLTLSRWFPALRTQAFAGNIVSAACMAGAAAVIWRILRELRVGLVPSIGLTALFALHPLVMQYGANGDSEAALVFFLALTCLGLLRWFERRDLSSLVMIGFALAFGYLSRQEFLAAGAASLLVIAGCAYREAAGTRAHRRWTAMTEATLAGMPFVFAVACWAGSAFIIVGTATSYLDVNSEQVSAAQSGIASVVGGTGITDRLAYYLGQLVLLEPLWSVVVLTAVIVAWRAHDRRVLAPLVTFGAVAAAQGTLFGAGSTFGWLRFAITVVPLTIISAGYLIARIQSKAQTATTRGRLGALRTVVPVVALAGACMVAIPSAVGGMTEARFGREEAASVHLLPGYSWAPVGDSYVRPHYLDGYDVVARYFDRRHLPEGSVLTDAEYTFPLMLKSTRPRQFIIPSDSDFERSVADPASFRVRYLLMTNGQSDALHRNYPIQGAGRNQRISIGSFVRGFEAGPQTLWLFKVKTSVTGERAPVRQR